MSTDQTQVTESNSARKRRLAQEWNAANPVSPAGNPSTVSREEKEVLSGLSKEVFGASSRWQKLISKGYQELVTEETTEYVPGEKEGDEGTTRKVQVPVVRSDGAKQSVTKYHTVESVKAYMLAQKVRLDALRAQIKKMQDDAKAKKAAEEHAKKIHEELTGSAI